VRQIHHWAAILFIAAIPLAGVRQCWAVSGFGSSMTQTFVGNDRRQAPELGGRTGWQYEDG
jgi:hypothetical protein